MPVNLKTHKYITNPLKTKKLQTNCKDQTECNKHTHKDDNNSLYTKSNYIQVCYL